MDAAQVWLQIPPSPTLFSRLSSQLFQAEKYLRGQRFEDDDELTVSVKGWLGDQDVSDWHTRWNKCVKLEGDYVKKIKQYKS